MSARSAIIAGPARVLRIWLEHANGLRTAERLDVRYFEDAAHHFVDVTDRPAETVVANRPIRIIVERAEVEDVVATAPKPAYSVPSMAAIRALPWNGLEVALTFAGAGGSSTGYRMAGYRVLYANEFIEAARDTYRANAASTTILDGRDIRTVKASDILKAIDRKAGELDVLDGSPPCSSFSTAGKREKGWNTVKKYSDGAQRSDDLFYEFARLVEGIRPRVFVAENVSGLVKGTSRAISSTSSRRSRPAAIA